MNIPIPIPERVRLLLQRTDSLRTRAARHRVGRDWCQDDQQDRQQAEQRREGTLFDDDDQPPAADTRWGGVVNHKV